MADSVEVKGLTFSTTGSGSVVVRGPGIQAAGIDMGKVATLSTQNFKAAASSPNVTPEVAALLESFDTQEVGSVQAGLTEAPKPAAEPPPPTTETQTSQQNKSYTASGGANDDRQSDAEYTTDSLGNTFKNGVFYRAADIDENSPPNPVAKVQSGQTQAGRGDSATATKAVAKPGKRLQNPLGNFSSYTYQLSLYMITPDAYAAFIDSGRKNINAFQDVSNTGNGAFLIAQSGGINNTAQKRAPYFDQDFFIDDLKITQAINGKDTGTSTNVTGLSFTITEPYGFSFLTRLRDAATQLAKTSRSKNFTDIQNPSRQFFVFGIQFLGYTEDGTLINSKDITGTNSDPTGNANGVYQRYFDIMFTDVKFKLDGKTVTYNIKAVSTPSGAAFGLKRGVMWSGAEIMASTVDQALMADDEMTLGILAKLNKDQQDLYNAKKISIPNKYSVVYLGESRTTIADASIVSPADLDKLKWRMKVENVNKANESASQEPPDPNTRRIKFDNGTPILQAIEQIIKQSDYMLNALKLVKTTEEEPNTKTKTENEVIPASKKTIKWYNIGVETRSLGWDEKQSDFSYDIRYIIQPYETPIVTSTYTNNAIKYYGPHKRYDYWFTGKNSEIIKYEQSMDNTFFNVTLDANGEPTSQGGSTDTPTITGIPQTAPKQGGLNQAFETQNSYMTSLFDPGMYAKAKIQILGDPDFLMQTNSSSEASVYNQFYGTDGFTISPNGGQVFIEINFKEPIDYYNSVGLFKINDNILFWRYPSDIAADINSRGGGVSYMVLSVTSSFSKGQFVQDIVANINTFGNDTNAPTDSNQSRETTAAANSGKNRSGTTGDTASSTGTGTSGTTVGFQQPATTTATNAEQGSSTSAPIDPRSVNISSNQQTTPTNNPATPAVASDDASNTNNTTNTTLDEGGRDPLDR